MSSSFLGLRKKAVWGPKRGTNGDRVWGAGTLLLALLVSFGFASSAFAEHPKLDRHLNWLSSNRNAGPDSTTSVIVRLHPNAPLPTAYHRYWKRRLSVLNGHVVNLPNKKLLQLANDPTVLSVHYNRPVHQQNFRTSLTVGTHAVQHVWGLTGAGVGIAVIDSGISTFHDDLMDVAGGTAWPYGNQRVAAFVDFVNGQLLPYDDNGHGSHVAGIIAGNGYDSDGLKAGVAPDASIVSLKVLDANGEGTIGNIIAALDWVVANHATYNIRVVNLSVGAGVYESYWTDPLTVAAKRAVDAGVVVVAAAGNLGKSAAGQEQFGGITAPGNAPWVLTVGASSTMGTPGRDDDTVASYSSRGPTYLDWSAKPDLVAPGTGTVSLAEPASLLYATHADALLRGTHNTSSFPYLSLSGTSMASPVVAGTVAVMVQANPSLTPNAIKAILQYTAQMYKGYNALVQGAGFLNTLGAVRLSRFYATANPGDTIPLQQMWSKHIIWGNFLLSGGVVLPSGNAWKPDTVWGALQTSSGDNIVWGSACDGAACDNVVWGSADGYNVVWGSGGGDNIVWGSDGGDNVVWGSDGGDNVVWGSSAADNIVWGSDGGDNIVWGSGGADNVVWGSGSDDNVVWGSGCGGADCNNIVWGSSDGSGNIWGTADAGDNIVWGSSGDANIVWGSDGGDNIVWGSTAAGTLVWGDWAVSSAPRITPGLDDDTGPLDQLTDEALFALMLQLEVPQAPTTGGGR